MSQTDRCHTDHKFESLARLDNWATRRLPARGGLCLLGTVTGRVGIPNGARILTSVVTAAAGRLVTTASGHVYELGDPSPDQHVSDPQSPLGLRFAERLA